MFSSFFYNFPLYVKRKMY